MGKFRHAQEPVMSLNEHVSRALQSDADDEGPSEVTLVMYSLFMAASSLIFGGLSLWHARDGGPSLTGLSTIDAFLIRTARLFSNARRLGSVLFSLMMDLSPQTMVWLASMLSLLVLLAFATNPSETSFRSYLTDLALHQHLHHFRQDAIDASDRRLSSMSSDELQGLTRREADRPSTQGHSFATRISVSLRTPAYSRNDYGLITTVVVSEQRHDGSLQSRRYVGAFGKWWTGGVVCERRHGMADSQKTSSSNFVQNPWGVSEMQAMDPASLREEQTVSTARQKSTDDTLVSVSQTEKTTIGRRKKHGNKARHTHSPLLSMSKDASTSYDSKGGEDSFTGERTSPNSPILNSDASLTVPAERAQYSAPHMPQNTESAHFEGVLEAQSQLNQVRMASEAARKNLQTQLDELRARKKDEDAARLDLKVRMKTLDEHKRQAEGMKREAEKRLKAANGLKELLENRTAAKAQEIDDLRKKEAVTQEKAEASVSSKAKRLAELWQKIGEQKEEEASVERDIAALEEKIEAMQDRLLEEQGNLQAAREMAAERHVYNDTAPPSQSGSELYLPRRGVSYSSSTDQAPDQFAAPRRDYFDHNAPFPSQQPHVAPWANGFTNAPVAPQARPLAHVAAMLGEDVEHEGADDAFDPTVLVPMQQSIGGTRFSPFSFDGSNMLSSDVEALSRSRMSSVTPISPFSSDLLPSNLFQNADEDERHAGILPGSRSERVEAALNRFGLDTSDTSDIEMTQDDDGEDASERQEHVQDKVMSGGRTWWGGRTRSKERSTGSMAPLSDLNSMHESQSNGDDSEVAGVGKRRSLSIFPKLSLNPGAKSFRGSIRRNAAPGTQADQSISAVPARMSVDEPYPSRQKEDLITRQAWNASSGHLPSSQHDYETLRRAFEADNSARPDAVRSDENWGTVGSGRNSGMGWPTHLDGASMRSSSDSVAQVSRAHTDSIFNGARRQPIDWLDDMIMPLERTTSRGSQYSTQSGANPRDGPGTSKGSRFALWRNASSHDYSVEKSRDDVENSNAIAEDVRASEMDNGTPTLETAASKPKRTSFLWSRKTDSNAIERTPSAEATDENSSTSGK